MRAVIIGVTMLGAALVFAQAPARPDLGYEERLLKEASVGTDGRALLAFFKDRTPSEDDTKRLADFVRALGSEDAPATA